MYECAEATKNERREDPKKHWDDLFPPLGYFAWEKILDYFVDNRRSRAEERFSQLRTSQPPFLYCYHHAANWVGRCISHAAKPIGERSEKILQKRREMPNGVLFLRRLRGC